MNVDSLLKTTLEALNVPVERLKYGGKAETFITYQLITGRDVNFADDDNGACEYTYRVDVYSKADYVALLTAMKAALKAAGFYGIVLDVEIFEQDTGYYHMPVEIKYLEV